MPKIEKNQNVMDAAVERMERLYEQGHRVIISFSGGKDSGVCVEVAKIAAHRAGRDKVEVIMRDEEIMFPGTFEYAKRVAEDPMVDFHWIYARQPVINYFNREMPYFWVFDDRLDPEEWVRQPPDYTGELRDVRNARAYQIPDKDITNMVNDERFPPEEAPAGEDAELYNVLGLRADESMARRLGIHSSGGYITTRKSSGGYYKVRPIYDWNDGDVWRAHDHFDWDYNQAYDTMARLGVPKTKLRIAPPTMHPAGIDQLQKAAAAWPQWFERVTTRLDGVNTAAQFGRHTVEPERKLGETWEDVYYRALVENAPDWIEERAETVKNKWLEEHRKHATTPDVSHLAPNDLVDGPRR